VFLIDLEGHREDDHVQAALKGMRSRSSMFKILGSYPMALNSSP
jgi:chorismate mutase/prephenate dehydratase